MRQQYIQLNFIVFKTKLINHITSILFVNTEVINSRPSKGLRAFRIYSFVPLTGGATAGIHILRLSTNFLTHFSKMFHTFPSRNLLSGNVHTMVDLFTMFNVHVLCRSAIFTPKFEGFLRLHV